MFCGNCGTENTNGAKFCKNCGKALEEVKEKEVKENKIPQQEEAIEKIKKLPKKTVVAACAAVVALIAVICIFANGGKTIDLNKYVIVEMTGYDGYGTARANIDWEAIEKKYDNKLSFTSQAKKEFGGLSNIMTPMEIMKQSISVRFDTTDGLTNGDKISYMWNIDEEMSNYINCKVKYKDDTYSVSGLAEVGTFDAFADLEVSFFGTAPNGEMNINYTGAELNQYDFNYDTYNGLSNGDMVKIWIDESNLEYYAENLGMVPETLEKEYKVEGLSSYLLKTADISEESLKAMQQQAKDVYTSYAAKNWDDCISLKSLTYLGNYLLTAKDVDTWGAHNRLYLVYKAQAKANYLSEGKTYKGTTEVYWYIEFNDLMIAPNGEVETDVTSYNTPRNTFYVDSGIGNSSWNTKKWYYYGYERLDDLYKEAVTSNLDAYNHEDNIDEMVEPISDVSEEKSDADGFILSNSDTELITKNDLEGLSAEECKIARNEIYARHGRKFNDKELQAYFNQCDWYEGTIESDDFIETMLSETELANKNMIAEYEEEKDIGDLPIEIHNRNNQFCTVLKWTGVANIVTKLKLDGAAVKFITKVVVK